MKKLLIILGSTATGKTDLALHLAKEFKGELIACDSRQVYQGLDIGTGKMPGKKVAVKKHQGFWEIEGIKIWMYDVANLKKQYTVADYVKEAHQAIDLILETGKLPIIVGGTGLYIKALTEGLSNLVIPIDCALREKLANLSIEQLQTRLQKLSPKKWQSLNNSDRQNPRRLIRAIEISAMDSFRSQELKSLLADFNILKIGLTAPRSILGEKIGNRVEEWIKEGIVDEVRNLLARGVTKKRIKQLGLEYRIIAEYLDGSISEEKMKENMKIKVRQYAKRQETWFKREGNIFWIDVTEPVWVGQVESRVNSWYYSLDDQTN